MPLQVFQSHQRLQSAMTLIETLAMIVILSMVTGALGLRIVGSNRSAQAREAMARWRDLDAQARIAAQIEGAVRLELDTDGRGAVLKAIHGGDVLSSLRWPEGFQGSLATSEDENLSSIAFDSRGRGDDYFMILRDLEHPRDSSVLTVRVCGLTGWIVQEDRP